MNAEIVKESEALAISPVPNGPAALAPLTAKGQALALRMFNDPHLLEPADRTELVRSLRESVQAHPRVSDLRVVLGMALCVNFEVEDAIEELEEGVRLAPDSFIAQLKLGELWMRLRVCPKAEDHTRQAALLASNHVQSELARKQAATIRTLMREGIERGGYKGPMWLLASLRKLWKREEPSPALETTS